MTPPAPGPPGERPSLRGLLPLPLVTALLGSGAVGAAVALAPHAVRMPLAYGAGAAALLLTLAVAFAVHARRTAKLLRHRLNAVSRDAGLLLQERARLAEEFGQERGRLSEEFVRERARLAEEYARERARLAEEFERERARMAEERTRQEETRSGLVERARSAEADRTAALAVTANVAGRMQALATGTLADLRAMEERHADEDVLADLLHLDHRTAQAGRLADSVAVLAGARSGRRWARPIPMESILRGAMGRIGAYRRVRLHSSSESAVAGHAAEGVMHALAELLDNAANFSPPTAEVHVYVEEVPAGVIVSVEDAGLVMSDVQLRRAERAVSGEASDLTSLTGTRLGLAVVGRLARKYGLKVSFRPSARGGTGVLTLIPQDVLASTSPAPAPATPPAPASAAPAIPVSDGLSYATVSGSVPEPAPTHDSASPTGESGSGEYPGLPRRHRGRSLAEAEAHSRAQADTRAANRADTWADTRADTNGDSERDDTGSHAAARFSSFRRAVRGAGGLDQAFVQGTATGGEAVTGSTDFDGLAGGLADEVVVVVRPPVLPPVPEVPVPEVPVPEAPAELPAVREPVPDLIGYPVDNPAGSPLDDPVIDAVALEPVRDLRESLPDAVRELLREAVRDTHPDPGLEPHPEPRPDPDEPPPAPPYDYGAHTPYTPYGSYTAYPQPHPEGGPTP